MFCNYISVDVYKQVVIVNGVLRKNKSVLSDLQSVSIAISSFKLSKFILKSGRVVFFESKDLSADDIIFLQSLIKG